MKTKTINLKTLILSVVMLTLFKFSSVSQTYWVCGGTAIGGTANNQIGTTAASSTGDLQFISLGTQYMDLTPSGKLGIGTATPSQMCSILGGNFNVATTTTYGYMLSDNMYLWNVGDPSSVYCGNNTGVNIVPSSSLNNSMFGDWAGQSLTNGTLDTYIGYSSGVSDNQGEYNTLVGAFSGQGLTGSSSSVVAWVGTQTVTVTVPGCFNTMCGVYCGEDVQFGKGNCYYGKFAGANNTGVNNSGPHIGLPDNSGNYNCMYGIHSGDGYGAYSSDSEAYFGTYTGFLLNNGNDNVMIGSNAGFRTGSSYTGLTSSYNVFIGGLSAQQHQGGFYDIVLGYEADAYVQTCITCAPCITCPITNAVAEGASAVVNNDNKFILGNNQQFVGIGESSDASFGYSGPQWNLEICTEHNPTYSMPGLGGGIAATANTYGGTGFSGLKFRDLTSNSTPVSISTYTSVTTPYPSGVLSVDSYGNVIYIPAASVFGSCLSPVNLTQNAGIGLNNFNFDFSGGGGSANNSNINSVIIGNQCVPVGSKLYVGQNSNDPGGSTGIKVINFDGYLNNNVIYYGLQSSVPTFMQSYCEANIAGLFNAPGSLNCPLAASNYAIYVPPNGGGVSIGYAYNSPFTNPKTLIQFNSGVLSSGNTYHWSDSILKTHVTSLGHGLDVIRRIQPISFRYNGKGGIDTIGLKYGVLAQALKRIAPYAIDSSYLRLDTSLATKSFVLEINEDAVMYTGINAIKQLDSTVTANGKGFAPCSGPIASILGNSALSLNHHNIYFQGNNSDTLNQNSVGIGYNCGNILPGKLSVWQNSGYNPAVATQSSIGFYVENDDLQYGNTLGGKPVYGVYSTVPGSGTNQSSVAGYFNAPGSNQNYSLIVPPNGGNVGIGTTMPNSNLEVDGTVFNSGTTFITLNSATSNIALYSNAGQPISYSPEYGILGSASNAQTVGMMNVGVYGGGFGTISGVTNVGVYGYGNNNSYTDYGGYFVGNVYTTGGSVSGSGYLYASDSAIKTQVSSFPNAMAIINKLKPRTYYFNKQNPYHMTLDTFKHYGFIAQDVQRVIPCMVHTVITPPQVDSSRKIIAPSDTFKALDYNQFTPLLAQGMQEHQQTIDSLRYTLDSIRSVLQNVQTCLSQLCNNAQNGHASHKRGSGDDTTTTNVTLTDVNAILLYQNIPNPFGTGGTKINYYLPQGTMGAMVVFYDNYGNQIKEVPLNQTGNGVLNITPDNLAAGIYSYSMVVNGKVIDTKRMVLQK